MESRGTVRLEWVVTATAIAVVGLLGFRAFGASAATALAGETATHRAPSGALSAQAAWWLNFPLLSPAGGIADDGAGALFRSVGDTKTDTRVTRGVETVSDVPLYEIEGSTIRAGLPDWVHERPQALRYGNAAGGGVYLFPPEAMARGIDGFFVPWSRKDVPAVDFERFDSETMRAGRRTIAVSFKSSRGSRPLRTMNRVLSEVRRNATTIREHGIDAPPGLPPIAAVDAFVSLSRLSSGDLRAHLLEHARAPATGPRWVDMLATRPSHGPPQAFRQILFETSDSKITRLTMVRDGTTRRPGFLFPDSSKLFLD